ncbi:MAG: hypothetical protein ACYDDE_00495 [bacterium]
MRLDYIYDKTHNLIHSHNFINFIVKCLPEFNDISYLSKYYKVESWAKEHNIGYLTHFIADKEEKDEKIKDIELQLQELCDNDRHYIIFFFHNDNGEFTGIKCLNIEIESISFSFKLDNREKLFFAKKNDKRIDILLALFEQANETISGKPKEKIKEIEHDNNFLTIQD